MYLLITESFRTNYRCLYRFFSPAWLPELFKLRIELMRIEQKCLFLNERSKAGDRRSRLLQICAHASLLCLFVFIHETSLPPNFSFSVGIAKKFSRNHQNSLKWSIYQVALWNIFRFLSFLYISKDTKPVNTFWRCLMSHFSTKWSLNFGRQTIEKSFGPFGKNGCQNELGLNWKGGGPGPWKF